MGRRLFAPLVAIALLGAVPVAAAGAAMAAPSSSATECKHGGWRNLADGQGRPFKNQGQCIKWRRNHPVTLGDVAGNFAGTTSFTFGTDGCDFVHQVFDATYPGSAAVGAVTLHLQGCVNINTSVLTYNGTFSISTGAGTLGGTVSGLVSVLPDLDFELNLNVTSATGSFSGLTGPLHVSLLWEVTPVVAVTGSVTAT